MARSSAATGFLLAVSFLTRLPVPMRKESASGQDAGAGTAYGWAVAWFPAVGLLIGALLGLFLLGLFRFSLGVRRGTDLLTFELVREHPPAPQ